MHLSGNFIYSEWEWRFARIFTAVFWLLVVLNVIFSYDSQPMPDGVCRFFNCSLLTFGIARYFTLAVALLFLTSYVFEKQMILSLAVLIFLSVILFTLQISNGSKSARLELLTMVLTGQWIAYLLGYFKKSNKNVMKNQAMMYSVQIVAAAYLISALCKLQVSGLSWVMDAENVAVRVMRSYSARAIDANDFNFLHKAQWITEFILQNTWLIKTQFAIALILELAGVFAFLGKRQARVYGILILFLHSGILLIFGGVVLSFMVLGVIYLVNVGSLFQFRKEVLIGSEKMSLVSLLWLPLAYIGLSFAIGEIHPFSTYPMFSNADNRAELYYLASAPDSSIATKEVFNVRCNQIKNLTYINAEQSNVRIQDTVGMKTISAEVLSRFIIEHKQEINDHKYSQILMMRREFIRVGEHIQEANYIMARQEIP